MADHGHLLPPAELFEGAAQDFPTFQVMGDRAIAQIDPVVQEQTVLTRNP
ncbi:MAG: Uncharacterised protein [Synechococcus sp. MIT S9220]|nr:MAG: Uncharacterised protein [Synechococcus sp. MIT S9220]